MNKINEYIKNLQRGAGADRAIYIARARMLATDPKNWSDMPSGDIFFPRDPRQKTGYREKELQKLHNWWTNVYHVMKKLPEYRQK
jgi:hypothetical protein